MDASKIRKIVIGDFSVKRLIRSVVFIYVSVLVFAYFFSDRLIFQAPEPGYGDGPEIIKIETADGGRISAIYLEEPNSEYTILYSHGNGEDIEGVREVLELLQYKGFSVLAYDYRGYGTSAGSSSEKKSYKDVEAAYEHLVGELNTPAERVIALGRSVGGGVATHLACRKKVAGLILESSFVSAFRVATRVPLLPFDKFRNISKIKKVRCPVLVIHGKKDKVVPFWHGEKLYKRANEPKLKFWVEEAGHNDLVSRAGSRYLDVIKEFTDAVKARSKSPVESDVSEP
jgi:fermentation-respiration switch protein FrsA (DUF1100 family)